MRCKLAGEDGSLLIEYNEDEATSGVLKSESQLSPYLTILIVGEASQGQEIQLLNLGLYSHGSRFGFIYITGEGVVPQSLQIKNRGRLTQIFSTLLSYNRNGYENYSYRKAHQAWSPARQRD